MGVNTVLHHLAEHADALDGVLVYWTSSVNKAAREFQIILITTVMRFSGITGDVSNSDRISNLVVRVLRQQKSNLSIE